MATQQGQINIGNLTRVAGLGLFFKSLDKASNSGLWAEELKAVARLKNYAPGMIMGANTALAQESQALNQAFLMATKLQTLNSSMVPKSSPIGINIQNNLGTQPDAQNGLFLTATMAQKQLEEMGLTKEPLDLNALALTHGIHSGLLPEIEATMDDAQGTASIDIKELGFSSQLDESEEIDDHHEARRAKEMGIVDGLTY